MAQQEKTRYSKSSHRKVDYGQADSTRISWSSARHGATDVEVLGHVDRIFLSLLFVQRFRNPGNEPVVTFQIDEESHSQVRVNTYRGQTFGPVR